MKTGIKVHLDPQKKRELANKCPEPARSMILELPDYIDSGDFVAEWTLIERLVRKVRGTFRVGREEGTAPVPGIAGMIALAAIIFITITTSFNRVLQIQWYLIPFLLPAVWLSVFLLLFRHGISPPNDGQSVTAELTEQHGDQ